MEALQHLQKEIEKKTSNLLLAYFNEDGTPKKGVDTVWIKTSHRTTDSGFSYSLEHKVQWEDEGVPKELDKTWVGYSRKVVGMNTQEFANKVLCENGAWLRDNAKSSEALKLYACIDALSAMIESLQAEIQKLKKAGK